MVMQTLITEYERPKLKNPIFVEGLPGIGNVGRIAAGYLVDELKAKKFAELVSPHFLPFVMLHEGSEIHLLKNEFYYYKGKERDIILLIGDCQSLDPAGHYSVANKILEYVQAFGCKEIITLGGLGIGETPKTPKVIGAVTDGNLVKKYGKLGIEFDAEERVGTIVGASGLLLGLGKQRGMEGLCLMGETSGFPIIADPRSAESVLEVLAKIAGVKISMKKLDQRVDEMKKFIKKLEGLQKKAVDQLMSPEGKESELKYIG